MTTLNLYTDGGSRNNPGPAATGGVLKDETDQVINTFHKFLGTATNNVAEYQALIQGLQLALTHKPTRLICHLDSKLVVEQSLGHWKIKEPTLRPLAAQIQKILLEHPEITLTHIPRAKNSAADALVNQALDAAGY